MKLTVLGKYGPYPAAGGGTSSYLLRSESANIALDFGSGALGRYRRFCDRLDAIVISHLHFDHICDLLPLVYEAENKGFVIPLYMPFDDGEVCALLRKQRAFDIRQISDGAAVYVKDVELRFIELIHPVKSYGVKATSGGESLFYSGDTSYTEKVAQTAKGCDFALLDAAQPADSPDSFPHMSVLSAALIAEHTGARVLVTHINPNVKIEREAKKLGLELARENATYDVRR